MVADAIYLTGKICPYCNGFTDYVDSKEIYGISYGMMYLCRLCKAYVGVHKGTDVALGRLANGELRRWKMNAHACFDPLWKKKVATGQSKNKARKEVYQWLSEQMGLPVEQTHIGMFDVEECKKVVEICKPKLEIK